MPRKSPAINNVSSPELLGAMPRFSIAAAAAGMAQYLQQSQQHQNSQMKGHGASIVDRPHLYWPGLQGLVANPMAWRDRLTGSSKCGFSMIIQFMGRLIMPVIMWEGDRQERNTGWNEEI